MVNNRGDELASGALRTRLEKLAEETGRPLADVAKDVSVLLAFSDLSFVVLTYVKQEFHAIEGKIIEIPGLPQMYDYENYPQAVSPYYNFINGICAR